jgi:hypothetical protein
MNRRQPWIVYGGTGYWGAGIGASQSCNKRRQVIAGLTTLCQCAVSIGGDFDLPPGFNWIQAICDAMLHQHGVNLSTRMIAVTDDLYTPTLEEQLKVLFPAASYKRDPELDAMTVFSPDKYDLWDLLDRGALSTVAAQPDLSSATAL